MNADIVVDQISFSLKDAKSILDALKIRTFHISYITPIYGRIANQQRCLHWRISLNFLITRKPDDFFRSNWPGKKEKSPVTNRLTSSLSGLSW